MHTKHNFWALLAGILLVICSLFFFMDPLLTSAMLGIYIGSAVLVVGVFDIIRYIKLRSHGAPAAGIGWGIFDVICGVLLLSGNFLDQAVILPYMLGFWLVFIGVGRCFAWGALRKTGLTNWHTLVLGILIVLFGMLTVGLPLISAVGIGYLIGTGVLFFGVSRIVDFFTGRDSIEALPWV